MSKDESKRSSSSSKADKASKKRKKEGAIKEEAPAVVEAAAEVAVAAAEAAVEDDKPAKESKKEKKDKKDKDKKRKAEAEADPVGEPVEGAADAVEEDGESEKAPVNEEIPELDEAPVSRKEARKAKRRKVAKDEDGESEDESSPAKAEASKAPRSTHGVWIGNLNFQTTKEALLSWLRAQGLEDDPVRVNMPGGKKKTEKNRGCVPLPWGGELFTDSRGVAGLSTLTLPHLKRCTRRSAPQKGILRVVDCSSSLRLTLAAVQAQPAPALQQR